MARVLASQDEEWILVTIEGPRTVRTALRQSIPGDALERMADEAIWRIHEEAWPTACAVFGRFGLSIEWAAASPTVNATEAVELLGGDVMQERAQQGFSVTIVSAGLTVERAVDADTAWSILAMILGREASASPNGRVAARA